MRLRSQRSRTELGVGDLLSDVEDPLDHAPSQRDIVVPDHGPIPGGVELYEVDALMEMREGGAEIALGQERGSGQLGEELVHL